MMKLCAFVIIVAGACAPEPSFKCETDEQCGTDGTCEPTNFCSYPDTACASGRRYDTHAGASSELCVDADGVALAELAFRFDQTLVDEVGGTYRIPVGIAAPSEYPVSADVEVVGGTASSNDFVLATQRIEIPPGETRAMIELAITNDHTPEPEESVELALARPTNARITNTTAHIVTIAATALPRVQFAIAASQVGESAGAQTISVLLDAPTDVPVTVGVAYSGTASAADHSFGSTVVTIPPGATTATIAGAIIDDALDEDAEKLDLDLGASSGAIVGTTASYVLTIDDNDAPPVVAFESAGSSVTEGANATAALVLSAPSGRQVTVAVTAPGFAANVAFPPGITRRDVTVGTANDADDEQDEVVALHIATATNATLGALRDHALTIIDNDPPPAVQFALASSTGVDFTGSHTVTVTLSARAYYPITFGIEAIAGSATTADFSVSPGPYTIPAGFTTTSVPITLVDDGDDDESFVLKIVNPSTSAGGQATHTVTILGF